MSLCAPTIQKNISYKVNNLFLAKTILNNSFFLFSFYGVRVCKLAPHNLTNFVELNKCGIFGIMLLFSCFLGITVSRFPPKNPKLILDYKKEISNYIPNGHLYSTCDRCNRHLSASLWRGQIAYLIVSKRRYCSTCAIRPKKSNRYLATPEEFDNFIFNTFSWSVRNSLSKPIEVIAQ